MNSKLIERLKKHCEWWKSQGTPEDNGYPYHKHFPDCDICQAIAELEQLREENAAMQEALNDAPGWFY